MHIEIQLLYKVIVANEYNLATQYPGLLILSLEVVK